MADCLLITRNGVPEEILVAETPTRECLSTSFYDIGSMNRRLSQEAADNMSRAECLGKAVNTRVASMSTAIGDELAGIYDHMEHCRDINCLNAKGLFDEIQSSGE